MSVALTVRYLDGHDFEMTFRSERYARGYIDAVHDNSLISSDEWDRLLEAIADHWPNSPSALNPAQS